jgi:hypothetical protein
MQNTAATAEVFLHVRVVIGIIVGLSIARLLAGLAYFVQHPGRKKVYFVHLGWAMFMLLMLVHFWWWEFWLSGIRKWTFQIYLFLIVYAIILFLLCALLFPDEINEYAGYEDFFIARRKWFFGILATTFIFDFVDTILKGWVHLISFGSEYEIRLAVYLLLCLIATATPNRRFHQVFIVVSLFYQVTYILRLFDTLS